MSSLPPGQGHPYPPSFPGGRPPGLFAPPGAAPGSFQSAGAPNGPPAPGPGGFGSPPGMNGSSAGYFVPPANAPTHGPFSGPGPMAPPPAPLSGTFSQPGPASAPLAQGKLGPMPPFQRPPSPSGFAPPGPVPGQPGFSSPPGSSRPFPPPPGQPGFPAPPGAPPFRPPAGQPGFSAPPPGQPGFPPPPGQAGFPPPPGQAGFPPPPGQSGFPPGQQTFPQSQPGFPPGQPGFPPPQGQPGFPAPPGAPGFPPPPGASSFPPPPGAAGFPPPPGVHAGLGGAAPFPPPPGGRAPGIQPPPPGSSSAYVPPPPGAAAGGFDPYSGQRLAEHFESLSLTSGIGPSSSEQVDVAAFPRPVGELLEPATTVRTSAETGNCTAENMCLTINAIPNSSALRARWALPMGVVVHPMSDEALGREVPVVNLASAGIVRCRRCRTYINPFVTWQDGGRRYKCNVCNMFNDVPLEYYCQLDHNGRRRDAEERPELSRGTVEWVAPAEYMVRSPMPPVYFFVIDVSYSAVMSGMLATTTAAIKSCLDQLPGDERTLVGFITFDSTLHFYHLKAGLSSPQMMVVTEVDDPFVPMPDDLLVNLSESRAVVEALLDGLPASFANNTTVDAAMGPALQAAYLVINHVGGKVLLFQSSIPSIGVGRVKNRENPSAYGTEREASMRNPDDPFFKRFAAECSKAQITVDVFAFNCQYMDLASLAAIPRYTCGELRYYPGFTAQRDGIRLHSDLVHNLLRPTAWEAVMRVRCSKGLRMSSFHGHFFTRSTDLLALPTCDPDKGFALEMAHEESMLTSSVVHIQCALLYTNSNGERRIRVHTLQAPVVSELQEVYKAANTPAIASLLSKLAIEKSWAARLDETRNAVQAKVVQTLKEFRILNATHGRAPNRLIYPDSLRYLPIFALGLCKTAALRGGGKDVFADERMAVAHDIMAAPIAQLLRMCYPQLYPVLDPTADWGDINDATGDVSLPLTAPLSVECLDQSSAYLLDNGRIFVLWLGRNLSPQWVADVFGIELKAVASSDMTQLSPEPVRDTLISKKLCAVLSHLRKGRARYQPCFVTRQGSGTDALVAPLFVEDKTATSHSYLEYMLAVHRGVMSK